MQGKRKTRETILLSLSLPRPAMTKHSSTRDPPALARSRKSDENEEEKSNRGPYIFQALLAEGVELGLLLLQDLHVLQLLVHGEAALAGPPGLLALLLHRRRGLAVGLAARLVLLQELFLLALQIVTRISLVHLALSI